MSWKGESRRHSLARKGIKTAQQPMIASAMNRSQSDTSPYFDMDLSEHNLPFIADLHEDPEYNDRRRERTHEVILMTSDEYLQAIDVGSKGRSIQIHDFKLDPIKEDMEKGDKFSMPFLEYDMGYSKPILRQEGIHRAVASKEMGHELIPVVVVYPSTIGKYRKVSMLMSDLIAGTIDKTKIRSKEQRRQEYEKIYGERWDL